LFRNQNLHWWEFCRKFVNKQAFKKYSIPVQYEFNDRGTCEERALSLARLYSPTLLKHPDNKIDLQGLFEILENFDRFHDIKRHVKVIKKTRNTDYAHISAESPECDSSSLTVFGKDWDILRESLRALDPSKIFLSEKWMPKYRRKSH
jgi:hypothetical protein